MREERIETDGIPARLYDPGDARAVLLLGHGASLVGHWQTTVGAVSSIGPAVALPSEAVRHSVTFVNRYTA